MKYLFYFLSCFILLSFHFLFGQIPNGSIKYSVNGREEKNLFGAIEGDLVRLYLYPKEQSYLKAVRKTSIKGEEDIRTQVYIDTNTLTLVLDYIFVSTEEVLPVFEKVQSWQGANTMPYHSKDSSLFFIYTPEDLAYFSQNCHSKWALKEYMYNKKATTCIRLINNLDLGGLQQQEWFPVGQYFTDSMYYFHANIEGNNKKIKNLYLNCKNLPTKKGAFVYRASGIRIDKLHLIAAKILSVDSGVAAMVFYLDNGEISSCSVEGDFYGKSLDSSNTSAIIGFVQATNVGSKLNNNIFFGNIFTNMQLQAGFTGFSSADTRRNYCLSYGNLQSQRGAKYGIAASRTRVPAHLRACINYGMIYNSSDSSKFPGFALSVQADASSADTCYSDIQLCPNVPLYGKRNGPWENNSDTLPTRSLLGFHLQSRLGDYAKGFIFEEGLYPRLRDMDERPSRLAAAPLILNEHDHALNVRNHFYVDTNYGVRWYASNPDIIRIRGDQGIIVNPCIDSLTYVYAQLDDFTKRVYLSITEKPSQVVMHIDTTLCVGTPFLFRGCTYNSAVVHIDTIYAYTTTAPDSIFSLDLKYTPRFEKWDTVKCSRNSLPFLYNDSLLIDFGSYQFNYTNLQGCDSIVYLNLEEIVEKYWINISSNAGGEVNPLGDFYLSSGDSLRVFWQSDTCFVLDSLFLDNNLYSFTEQSSYLFSNISEDHSLRFVFRSDSIRLRINEFPQIHCGQEFLQLRFSIQEGNPTYYDLNFDNNALDKGFVPQHRLISDSLQEIRFPVPFKPYVNFYTAYLQVENEKGCKSVVYPIPFEIHYPSEDVVRQKWTDVLAVRNEEFNGGYVFTAFQWIQDSKILKNDTLFRLFQPKGLRENSVYKVLLSRKDGTTISSCPISPNLEKSSLLKVYPNPIKENGSISIQIDDCQETDCGQISLTDMQGKMLSVHPLKEGLNIYTTTLKQGLYLVEITRKNGQKSIVKLMVIK